MEPDTEELLEALNTVGFDAIEKNEVKSNRKNKTLSTIEESNNTIEDGNLFVNDLYEKRMQKVEKRNAALHEAREKAKAKAKAKEKEQIIIKEVAVKIAPIPVERRPRFLMFRPPTAVENQLKSEDSGYHFEFPNGAVALVRAVMEANGFCEGTSPLLIWHIGCIPPAIYSTLGPYQRLNHFPKSFEITRKDLMLQNLSKMQNRHPQHYNFFPSTFILPQEKTAFLETYPEGTSSPWFIIKPHNSSQGKGIWLSDNPREIAANHENTVVVSRYVNNPLLVNGLKFDLRVYVAVTSFDPLRIYVYEEGLTRFATAPFVAASRECLFAHLTNYSLNKFANNFEANDDVELCQGHKWGLRALRTHLKGMGIDDDLLFNRVDELVVKTLLAIENAVFAATQMTVPFRDTCFEVLGFDVLIDDTLRPWLLEVNLSPSLNADSPLDLAIKGEMLADLFTLIGVMPPDAHYRIDPSYRASRKPPEPRTIINDSAEELKRCGRWRRVFPTHLTTKFKPLFEVPRLSNLVLEEEIRNQKFRHPQDLHRH